jgi:hypothetical protein
MTSPRVIPVSVDGNIALSSLLELEGGKRRQKLVSHSEQPTQGLPRMSIHEPRLCRVPSASAAMSGLVFSGKNPSTQGVR